MALDQTAMKQARPQIVEHRTSQVTLSVLAPGGKPLAGAKLTMRQMKHKFLLGCNIFTLGRCKDEQSEQAYRQRFLDLLNFATLPFYWARYEPQSGQTDFQHVHEMATWCRDHGLTTKGHPLCWHETTPAWLADLPMERVQMMLWIRCARETAAFAGLNDIWDVVNEVIRMPGHEVETNRIAQLCDKLGRVEFLRQAFAHARAGNSKATLILNDFDTSQQNEFVIESCLKAGVTIDAIGIQSHMHKGYWGAEKTLDVCQRFSRFGLPVHFTELTLLSGALKTDDDWHTIKPGWDSTPQDEQRQAEQVEEFYTLLFSQPRLAAITWWDMSDAASWQGAPSGLLRKDMSPKPAYESLHRMFRKDWWTGPTALTTDAAGSASFRGFLGDYEIDLPGGKKAPLTLDQAGNMQATVKLET